MAEAANRAYQEQVEELELLYRMTPVGLSLIDRDYRVLRINERLAAMSGAPVHEQIGRTVRECLPQIAPAIAPGGIWRVGRLAHPREYPDA